MAYIQAPFSTQIVVTPAEVPRRSANYHPSVWGNYFLPHASHFQTINASMEERHQELKEQVRTMVITAAENPSDQQLNLIDQIKRLGISYHFESEIEMALQHSYDKYGHQHDEDDLHTLALRFRLLRQQGHNVSSDVFENFKDDEGKFKKSMTSDVRGMLSLYEASHMKVHGEKILDEALEFTTNHLESMKANLSNPLAARVAHALNQPIQKSFPRLETRFYISLYQGETSQNQLLLDFAKLDFNLLQQMHQRELGDATGWWKNLNFATKLPFARDRMVECYFWILGVYFEPQYSLARKILTKVINMASVIDDIYDSYGTFEELILFTEAIERWDMCALDLLPEYMRECYRALLDVYSEMEEELASQGISLYRVHYAKAEMKRLVKAYLEEARWFHEGYVPTMDEYLRVALVTGAFIMLSTVSFVGMREQCVTKEAFEWISNNPLIVKASSVICRLKNDIVGHEFEQERGHAPSAVECYIKQHGVTKREVHTIFEKEVMDAWDDINQECIFPTAAPMPLLKRVLNFTRVLNFYYTDTDEYTNSKTRTKELIASVLVHSVL